MARQYRDWVGSAPVLSALASRYAAVALTISAAGPAMALPTFDEVRAAYVSSEALLLDRHGEPLQSLRLDVRARRLEWVGLGDVSPALRKAVIDAEDRRFEQHGGVDWKSMGAAAWGQLAGSGRRGGSTLTMQVAALLDKSLAPERGKRSLSQKWRQVLAARELEQAWRKDQIFEAYLNLVTYRGELQGVAAASRVLLGKQPSGLNRVEALLFAALLPAPRATPAAVARRACILAAAGGDRALCKPLQQLAASALSGLAVLPAPVALAPHVARKLARQPGGRVPSSLDADLQRFAAEVLHGQLQQLEALNVRDGAALVVENETGEVLAYVGNAGELASARYVDGVRAPRQAGSTLKPFLYGLAIEMRLLTAASVLDDSPINLSTPAGLYIPQNYDRDFKGWVSLRTALASSLNIPAVRTVLLTGTDSFHERLRQLGYQGLTESAEHYGYALALGSAEVSLWEQVNAYRTLANGGRWSELRMTVGGNPDGTKRVISEAAAYIISDILSDRGARSVTFGLESPLATGFWSAAKTGTSKDMRDNWAIGYSRKYTVGVWVGNFSGEPMWDVSGVTGAAPVWHDIMNYLHHDAPGAPPRPPASVVASRIEYADEMEPQRREWFVRGTETSRVSQVVVKAISPRITYPGNGTIIALDPDIPGSRQAIFFEPQHDQRQLAWKLNGQTLPREELTGGWQPVPGHHQLSLVDETGRVLDSVKFEVRGVRNTFP